MKNVVFMTAVKVPDMEYRSAPYEYGIKSFKHWCNKNNCELVVLDELIHPNDIMRINYHRYYAFDILDNSGIDYDQILITDADAVIHPDCPNFFELTDRFFVRSIFSMQKYKKKTTQSQPIFPCPGITCQAGSLLCKSCWTSCQVPT